MKGCKRIFVDVETVGPRDPAIIEMLRQNLLLEEPPGQATGTVKTVLERAGRLDYYQSLSKGKQEWLAANWNEPDMLEARLGHAIERAAVDTLLAEVICLSYALDDEDAMVIATLEYGKVDERRLLETFRRTVMDHCTDRTTWIGHNSDGFDLPLLNTRFRRHGLVPPAAFPQWRYGRIRGRTFDTMKESASNNPFIRAQKAAIAHGMTGFKTVEWDGAPMDGSRVAAAYEADQYDVIAEYCMADVIATRELARRMTYDWLLLEDEEPVVL